MRPFAVCTRRRMRYEWLPPPLRVARRPHGVVALLALVLDTVIHAPLSPQVRQAIFFFSGPRKVREGLL